MSDQRNWYISFRGWIFVLWWLDILDVCSIQKCIYIKIDEYIDGMYSLKSTFFCNFCFPHFTFVRYLLLISCAYQPPISQFFLLRLILPVVVKTITPKPTLKKHLALLISMICDRLCLFALLPMYSLFLYLIPVTSYLSNRFWITLASCCVLNSRISRYNSEYYRVH